MHERVYALGCQSFSIQMEELCIHRETEALSTAFVSAMHWHHTCFCSVAILIFQQRFHLHSLSRKMPPVNNQIPSPTATQSYIITQSVACIASSLPLQPTKCKLLSAKRQLGKSLQSCGAGEQRRWMWCAAVQRCLTLKNEPAWRRRREGGGCWGLLSGEFEGGSAWGGSALHTQLADSFIHWF